MAKRSLDVPHWGHISRPDQEFTVYMATPYHDVEVAAKAISEFALSLGFDLRHPVLVKEE